MGEKTLKERAIELIGHIGWILFCWSYGGEEKYLNDIENDIKRSLEKEKEIIIPKMDYINFKEKRI